MRIFFDYPKELGTGYRRLIWLQDGFWLRVREFECREFIRCDDYEEGWTALVLSFFICGDARVVIHKTNDYLNEISGQNSLEFGSAMETEEWPCQPTNLPSPDLHGAGDLARAKRLVELASH